MRKTILASFILCLSLAGCGSKESIESSHQKVYNLNPVNETNEYSYTNDTKEITENDEEDTFGLDPEVLQHMYDISWLSKYDNGITENSNGVYILVASGNTTDNFNRLKALGADVKLSGNVLHNDGVDIIYTFSSIRSEDELMSEKDSVLPNVFKEEVLYDHIDTAMECISVLGVEFESPIEYNTIYIDLSDTASVKVAYRDYENDRYSIDGDSVEIILTLFEDIPADNDVVNSYDDSCSGNIKPNSKINMRFIASRQGSVYGITPVIHIDSVGDLSYEDKSMQEYNTSEKILDGLSIDFSDDIYNLSRDHLKSTDEFDIAKNLLESLTGSSVWY